MKRVAVIALVCYMAFALEFLLFNFWGKWGKPELLILTVIFFNLYLGIRFSIIAAVFSGLFKDSLGVEPFGTYLLIYICAGYLTTLVRRYLYQKGSSFSRGVLTFFVLVGCFVVQALLTTMRHELNPVELLAHILVPQLLTTLAAAAYVFGQLRNIGVFFALKS
jgi:rod shape-determining protein MreD